jgi:hypothetical protein
VARSDLQNISPNIFLFSDQFSQIDVMVDGSSVMDAGRSNTVVGIVVNQPGTVTPVESSVVEDALHQTIQEDGQTQITNLTIGVVNAPTVSDNQRDNAISVRLTGTQPSKVRFVFTKIDENHITQM